MNKAQEILQLFKERDDEIFNKLVKKTIDEWLNNKDWLLASDNYTLGETGTITLNLPTGMLYRDVVSIHEASSLPSRIDLRIREHYREQGFKVSDDTSDSLSLIIEPDDFANVKQPDDTLGQVLDERMAAARTEIQRKNYPGPYGNYPAGSFGAVMNALVEQEGWPTNKVDEYVFGNGTILTRGKEKLVGSFIWTDDDVSFDWVVDA